VVTPYSDEEEDQDDDSETSNIPLIQTSDNNNEFTDVKQPYEILSTNSTVSQVVAQTIVNAFVQSTPGFIPAICTTYGNLTICGMIVIMIYF
jgi:NADH/NAD ratio-sensing transcriptional regulator Rex